MKEKYFEFTRKLKDARESRANAETYPAKLLARGLDPASDIFYYVKSDMNIIESFLLIMDKYLRRISGELDKVYRMFLCGRFSSEKLFYDEENTIMRLFDIVSDAEKKCMQRRGILVRRCLDKLNPFLSNLLDN